VEIGPEFSSRINEHWLRRIAQTTLEMEGLAGPLEMGIVITGDEEVRELNRRYRGLDETTDVLSFALEETVPDAPTFVTPPDSLSYLGDVVISNPQAARQAAERGEDPERELALLVVHGILHLLGYDHGEEEAEKAMRAKEKAVLQAVFKQDARAQ
jgi:probable rRNA maturation factor